MLPRLFVLFIIPGFFLSPIEAQNFQQGLKTTEPMIVAYSRHETPSATFNRDLNEAFRALWAACLQKNWHPLGKPIVALDLASLETGMLRWEAWLPLIDALEPATLAPDTTPAVKHVASARVVYTYRMGLSEQISEDIQRLQAFAQEQNLSLSPRTRIIAYLGPQELTRLVLEIQIEEATPQN